MPIYPGVIEAASFLKLQRNFQAAFD